MTDLQKYLDNKGLEILPDAKGWVNRFHIKSSSSNRLYVVAQRANGTEWGCSCPGWRIAKNGVRKCQHLTEIMPLILAAENSVKQKQIA